MSLKNYDPARTAEGLMQHLAFSFDDGDVGEQVLSVPENDLAGKNPDEVRVQTHRAYEVFRRSEDYAEARSPTFTGEEAMQHAVDIYSDVHLVVAANCCDVYFARSEEDTKEARAEQLYIDGLNEKIDVEKRITEALDKSARILCKDWIDHNGPEYAQSLVRGFLVYLAKNLVAAAIFEADEQVAPDAPSEEWHKVFEALYRERTKTDRSYLYQNYVMHEAQIVLENDLKPVTMPFEELRTWAGLTALEAMAEGGVFPERLKVETSGMMMATSKLAGHLNGFITNRRENHAEQLEIRVSGRTEVARAYSRLDLPRNATRPNAVGLLEKMHKTLLRHKEESASLLKTHLYLVDRAYDRGGDSPTFTVDMDELLEAKGYKRRSDGSFHPNTYREEWGRIATLAGCWLELRREKKKSKRGKEETFIDETPYWEVRARRRLEEGEALGLEIILLENPEAPIIKAVVIQPGLWWGISDRGSMRFCLPREVLALPTDGKGNETQRMAVQIAATLALWVRSSQNQHAGKERNYGVGKILEASGIKARLDFEKMHRKDVARLRKYLAGEVGATEPSGALHHLTSLGAFDIRIRDEDAFWASGRGWQARFWESQLAVAIPDLGIEKRKKPRKVGKRKAAA